MQSIPAATQESAREHTAHRVRLRIACLCHVGQFPSVLSFACRCDACSGDCTTHSLVDGLLRRFAFDIATLAKGIEYVARSWTGETAVFFRIAGGIQLVDIRVVSIGLAVTFALYGLVRKKANVGPLSGLFAETLLLTPIAIIYLTWQSSLGQNQFLTEGSATTLLLICAGVLTALPMMAFAAAASRLSLTILGFMMYLNPTSTK